MSVIEIFRQYNAICRESLSHPVLSSPKNLRASLMVRTTTMFGFVCSRVDLKHTGKSKNVRLRSDNGLS